MSQLLTGPGSLSYVLRRASGLAPSSVYVTSCAGDVPLHSSRISCTQQPLDSLEHTCRRASALLLNVRWYRRGLNGKFSLTIRFYYC
ncbi:hypothetical protein XENTR_v10001266 [Xenopus tropicalis]|nr:hypothetical protein XENTR_v10001266 [Xenopus tropicalis]